MGTETTVYVLEEGCYSDRTVVGVYSSLDAAKAAAQVWLDTKRTRWATYEWADDTDQPWVCSWTQTDPDKWWPLGFVSGGHHSHGDFGITPVVLDAPAREDGI